MPLETTAWDMTDHLDTKEAVVAYLEAAFEDGDPAVVSAALGAIARSRGMSAVAREAELSRESLYRALSAGGNPSLNTVMKVLDALGLRLTVQAV